MKVKDCIMEINNAKDALDTINRYKNGAMERISNQHLDEIRDIISKYIDNMAEKQAY